jgi:hypothetical protein
MGGLPMLLWRYTPLQIVLRFRNSAIEMNNRCCVTINLMWCDGMFTLALSLVAWIGHHP